MLILTSLNTLGITPNNNRPVHEQVYEKIKEFIKQPKKTFHAHIITLGSDSPHNIQAIAELWNDEIEHKLLEQIKTTYHQNPRKPDFKHNDEFNALVKNYNNEYTPQFEKSYCILIKNPDTEIIEFKTLLPVWLREAIRQYPESYVLINGYFD